MSVSCSSTVERRDHFRANLALPVAYWEIGRAHV